MIWGESDVNKRFYKDLYLWQFHFQKIWQTIGHDLFHKQYVSWYGRILSRWHFKPSSTKLEWHKVQDIKNNFVSNIFKGINLKNASFLSAVFNM